jgi:hypothetical protein
MNLTFLHIPVVFGLSIEVYFFLLIIGVPTFFFWKWFFKNRFTIDKRRIVATWIATLFVTPVVYSLLVVLFVFGLPFETRRDFNQQQWLNDREGRFTMAHDIIKGRILIGKDTTEVKEVLGTPSFGGDTTQVWFYDMGMGDGYHSHNLRLWLDSNRRVASVEHLKQDD